MAPSDMVVVVAPSHRRMLAVLGAAIGVGMIAVLVAGVAVVRASRAVEPFDPLGDFPVQRVNSQVAGVAGPAVSATESLSVTGTKCSRQDVTVSGHHSWTSIDPPGTIVETGRTSGVRRTKGCTSQTFANPIPAEVTERVRELAAQGVTRSVWELTGEECPQAPAGLTPVCRSWQSQNFTIVVTEGAP